MKSESKEPLQSSSLNKELVRKNAVRKMGLTIKWLPIGIIALYFLFINPFHIYYFHGALYFNRGYVMGLIIASYFIPFTCHVLEFITGIKFIELSSSWDHLEPWQRGVLGTAIVLTGLILFIAIGATIATWYAHKIGM